jgi:DNA-binding NarL/FixJ family response regulator
MTTILIADDHPAFRGGIRALLSSVPGLDVVGEAADGNQAVALARSLRPDVVLMDLQMPGRTGIQATRELCDSDDAPRVLVLTMSDEDAAVVEAVQAGALGYLLKEAEPDDIVRAVQSVARGDAILGAGIARKVLGLAGRADRTRMSAAAARIAQLSPREREILAGVARGRGNAAIAAELFLSPKTVRNQVSILFTKLGVANRGEAIVLAREAGLGGGP